MFDSELYTIRWLGINKNQKSISIWGWLVMREGNRNYAFWGFIGTRVNFKLHHWSYKLEFLVNSAKERGYTDIEPQDYVKTYDEKFIENLEIDFMAATLGEIF